MEFQDPRIVIVSAACSRVAAAAGDGGVPGIEDLRALRQACTVASEAKILLDNSIATCLLQHCSSLVRSIRLNDCLGDEQPFEITDMSPVITVMVQTLANFAANKDDFCAAVWKAAENEGFQDLIELARRTGKRGVLGAAIATLFNCVCDDNAASTDRLNSFVRNRKLCAHLLLSIPMRMEATAGATVGSPSANDPALEWLHLLVQKVVTTGHVCAMFTTLSSRATGSIDEGVWHSESSSGSVDDDKSTALITHEQLTLLHCIEDVLEDNKSVGASHPIAVFHDLCRLMAFLGRYVIGSLCSFVELFASIDLFSAAGDQIDLEKLSCESTNGPTGLYRLLTVFKIVYLSPPPKDGEIDPVNREACGIFVKKWEEYVGAHEEIILLCSVLGSALSYVGNPECRFPVEEVKTNQNALVRLGLIAACVCCIPHRIEMLGKSDSADVTKNSSLLNNSKRQLAREALRLLANNMYDCVDAQDELRIIHGLHIVLINCTTDFNNPLSREWALLCVRNACAGNMANQEFIEEFKVKNVVQSEVLKDQGLDVQLNTTTGKFHVEKKP